MRPFDRYGPEHLLTLLLLAALAWILTAIARRGAGAPPGAGPLRRGRTAVRLGLAALLLGGLGFALADALPLRGLDWLEILPLHLCDLAVLLAVVSLVTGNRTATEILYFWGLTGTLIATITPDVSRGFPDPRCVSFFALHGAVAIAAVVMVFGVGVRPGRNAAWKVFAITNAYAALVAVIDFTADKNYLYLRAKPSQPTLLDALGPWPWYLLTADLLALVLFAALAVPFARRGREERSSGSPTRA